MFRGAGLGATLRRELAQTMRAQILNAGFATPVLEPIAKTFDRVRLSIRRRQINQVSYLLLCGVDAPAQRRQNGQFMHLDNPRTPFRFAEQQLAIALHLRPELDEIAAAHTGINQEIESKPRLRADRMA